MQNQRALKSGPNPSRREEASRQVLDDLITEELLKRIAEAVQSPTISFDQFIEESNLTRADLKSKRPSRTNFRKYFLDCFLRLRFEIISATIHQ